MAIRTRAGNKLCGPADAQAVLLPDDYVYVKKPSVKKPDVEVPSNKKPKVKDPNVKTPSTKTPSIKNPSNVKNSSAKDPNAMYQAADQYLRDREKAAAERAKSSPLSADNTDKAAKKKAKTSTTRSPSDDDGDTIAVQQKMKSVAFSGDDDSEDESPLSDLEQIERQVDESRKQSASKAGTNRPWGRKGKAPVREQTDGAGDDDFEMIEPDEAESVDEGSIDYNEDLGEEDEDGDDNNSVISISSKDDVDPDPAFGLQQRPWKVEGFSTELRKMWETMYFTLESAPMGNWENTEDYQREKDKEMLKYIEDFPLTTWVIPKEQVEFAYFKLLERTRWRHLGIGIYGNHGISGINMNATPFNRAGGQMHPQQQQQMPLNINPNAYQQQQRQPSMGGGGSRPGSVPQQQMAHRPPPPQQQQQMGMMMPPVLKSQHGAMPMNVPPGHHPQMMQGPPPPMHGHQQQMFPPNMQMGHPQLGQPYNMPQGLPYNVPPHHMMNYANTQMHAPRPGYGMPQGMPPPGMQPMPEAPQARSGRKRKETPKPATPPPDAPVPPYGVRDKPTARREFNKTGKRNMRKQAEALEFPWHRKLDFKKIKAEESWDDSGYDAEILDSMAAVREKNMPIIQKLDDELAEKQRSQRNAAAAKRRAKTNGEDIAMSSDAEGPGDAQDAGEEKKKRKSENIGGDPYSSGNFSFASEADRQKALALQKKTVDDIIDAAEEGKIDWDLCKEIKICWNPGKKGLTQDLVQAQFRIYDTLITRKQMETAPVFTRRAADCIVDFCPDMLWRETLLRIVSESGYGNKDVRDRNCYNGCHNDKATITKRIAAALGQKQTNNPNKKAAKKAAKQTADAEVSGDGEGSQAPRRRRGPLPKEDAARYQVGEQEWHEGNKTDFHNYVAFFGKRPVTRLVAAGDKRKKSEGVEGAEGAEGSDGVAESSSKRAKSEGAGGPSLQGSDEMEEGDAEQESEGESEDEEEQEQEGEGEEEELVDADDAVSEQSSSALDDISD